jgi:hypothetical protein
VSRLAHIQSFLAYPQRIRSDLGESSGLITAYTGFCLTRLPHKRAARPPCSFKSLPTAIYGRE